MVINHFDCMINVCINVWSILSLASSVVSMAGASIVRVITIKYIMMSLAIQFSRDIKLVYKDSHKN